MMFALLCMLFGRVCSVCVFFFKQKTAYEMRISYWSSDVCSSDLPPHLQFDLPRNLELLRCDGDERSGRGPHVLALGACDRVRLRLGDAADLRVQDRLSGCLES